MEVAAEALTPFTNGKFNALCDFVLRFVDQPGALDDVQLRLAMECLQELQLLNRRANPDVFSGAPGEFD
jgi:hypothetical protein